VDYDDLSYDEQTTQNSNSYDLKNLSVPLAIENNFVTLLTFDIYVINDSHSADEMIKFDIINENLIKFFTKICRELSLLTERLNDDLSQNLKMQTISQNELIAPYLIKYDTNFNQNNRMEENLKLRSTARNSIVTYNATQRVFTPRLGENRSLARSSDFTNSFQRQPFLGAPRILYERLLGKNKHNFFNVQLFKTTSQTNLNIFSNVTRVTAFPCFEFPFLIGRISPASKHI